MYQVNEGSCKWSEFPGVPQCAAVEAPAALGGAALAHSPSWVPESLETLALRADFWDGPGENVHYQVGKGASMLMAQPTEQFGIKKRSIFKISGDFRRGRMCPAMTITGCRLAVFALWTVWVWTRGTQAGISLEELPGSPFPWFPFFNKPPGR